MALAVDGDTLRAGKVQVRLWGIDCPELGQDGGEAARRETARLIEAHGLVCDLRDVDRYGRLVGLCRLDGAGGPDLARLLVEGGFCRDWPRYSDGFYARPEPTP
jgi:endonuclease YncB( thermonuclease family)